MMCNLQFFLSLFFFFFFSIVIINLDWSTTFCPVNSYTYKLEQLLFAAILYSLRKFCERVPRVSSYVILQGIILYDFSLQSISTIYDGRAFFENDLRYIHFKAKARDVMRLLAVWDTIFRYTFAKDFSLYNYFWIQKFVTKFDYTFWWTVRKSIFTKDNKITCKSKINF